MQKINQGVIRQKLDIILKLYVEWYILTDKIFL